MPLRFARNVLATSVQRFRPQLFFYKADPAARAGLAVSTNGDAIDVLDAAGARIIRLSRANAAYVVDMLNFFDYYFSSAHPVSIRKAGRTWRLLDFSTPRHHVVTGFDDFPVLCASMTEPYLTTQQYLDFADLRPGDVAFDIGAYSALTSIAFSKAVGSTGVVVAFEPDPSNFATAEVNVAAHRKVNGLANITLVAAAAAAAPGKVELSSHGAMGSALTSIVGGWRGETIEVACATLQATVDRLELSKVDFIKMDVEGAERDLVLGSGAFLRRYRPRLVIEPHLIGTESTSGPIVGYLESLGYRCELIEQHGVSTPLITCTPSPSA